MNEKDHVHALLRNGFPPPVLLERIENSAGRGMADAEGCYHGHEFWLEYKIIRGGVFHIEDHQVAWHVSRLFARSKTFVVARNLNELQLYRISKVSSEGTSWVCHWRASLRTKGMYMDLLRVLTE